MTCPKAQRAVEIGRPFGLIVARQRVDEVEADPLEMALGDVERGQPLARRMGAAKE